MEDSEESQQWELYMQVLRMEQNDSQGTILFALTYTSVIKLFPPMVILPAKDLLLPLAATHLCWVLSEASLHLCLWWTTEVARQIFQSSDFRAI